MRPYKVVGKRYQTVGSAPYGGVSRPSKLAAGMSATSARSKHYDRPERKKWLGRNDASALSVHGTLDSLAGMINWNIARSERKCPCCGQRVKAVVLSDRGRSRLQRFRRIRNGA